VTVRVAAAAVLSLLAGCATLPPPAAEGDWPARRQALQALDAWSLDGRIAVAAGDDGYSGGLSWTQAGEHAEVAFSGPMGGEALAIRVEGDALDVTLRGETYSGEDARRMIEERIGRGQALPVTEMRYWLVGAPAPGAPYQETLGDDRRLASLSQSGWQVRYDRYEEVGALSLPGRLEMKTEGLRLRVVASDWRLPP
jgi:outer membrane lipoprotein LolB